MVPSQDGNDLSVDILTIPAEETADNVLVQATESTLTAKSSASSPTLRLR